MKKLFFFSILICFLLISAVNIYSQQGIVKSWEGTLNISGTTLRIIIHVKQGEDGKLIGSLDSPDQGANGFPASNVTFENATFKVEVPSIGGVYEGIVNDDFTGIKGEWKQGGNVFPLSLTPIDPSKKEETLNFFSTWQGNLKVSAIELRIVLRFYKTANDSIGAFMDSPDQGANGFPASKVYYGDDSVFVEVSAIGGYYSGKFNADKTVIDGKWTQMGTTYPLLFEKKDKIEEALRPQEPKEPYSYNSEEVTFENKEAGITLSGTFTYPKEGSNFPAVVLVSGSGPQNRNEELLGHKPFLVWSDYLTKNGIAVLRFDDRGVGKSTGEFNSATTADFVTDAISAINYLTTRTEVNKSKLGIIGHSEGGLIAPMAANESANISFIVLAAGPAVRGDELLMLQTDLITKQLGVSDEDRLKNSKIINSAYSVLVNTPDSVLASSKLDSLLKNYYNNLTEDEKAKPENSRQIMDQQKSIFMTPWFRYFLSYDPESELMKLKIPVLAMYGENDLQVPPSQNKPEMEKILGQSGNSNFKVVVFSKLNHLFQESTTGAPSEYARIEQTVSPDMLKTMSGWIKEVTK